MKKSFLNNETCHKYPIKSVSTYVPPPPTDTCSGPIVPALK